MITSIKSSGNAKFKLAKSLQNKKNRVQNGMFTVEGIKSVKDAISAKAEILMIFISESFPEKEELSDFECYLIPDFMFEALSDTKTPQGILAVIKIREEELTLFKDKLYIYCDTVTDPGNLGTIIRTADAAGFGGVLLSSGCADLYSPKTVRSSMGSFFNIQKFTGVEKSQIIKAKEDGFSFYCGSLGENTISYNKADFKKPSIICVGNEANGISEDILSLADACLKIRIFGKAESLNVGVAAAILMYEAQRQREI